MEDGRLTDGQGHTVDFRNAVIMMTSNVGAQEMARGRAMGFASESEKADLEWKNDKDRILQSVRRTFRPEFLNRVDEMVVFQPLTRDQLLKIVDIMLDEIARRLADRGIAIDVTKEARHHLLEKGFDPKFGARPLRRTIQRLVEDRMADFLLEGKAASGGSFRIGLDGEELTFQALEGPEGIEEPEKADSPA
jgi:ATP-dependent Clp protease ATP-binding subunit ClpC